MREWDFQTALETVQNVLNVHSFFGWSVVFASKTNAYHFEDGRYTIEVGHFICKL